MKNYDGQEMTIRTTNRGKFQALPVPSTPNDMSRAPVFETKAEAEAYISRPMPEPVAAERELTTERMKYNVAYADILSRPELREMRKEIQSRFGEASWQSKLAGDHQRAVGYAIGKTSVMGRDIAAVRQAGADYQADESDRAWKLWGDATHVYEVAVQKLMIEAGIPIWLFRQPLLVTDTAEGQRLRAEYEAKRANWIYPDENGNPVRHG
jgi:hypothetical protein